MPTLLPITSADASGSISVVDDLTTEIDGVLYRFIVRWNDLAEAWFLDIYDDNNAPLILSVRVSTGVPLARWLRHPLTTRGILLAVDTGGRFVDPGRYDLGTRVILVHYTEAEVLAAIQVAG